MATCSRQCFISGGLAELRSVENEAFNPTILVARMTVNYVRKGDR